MTTKKAEPGSPEALDARLRLAERDIDRQVDWNRTTDETLGQIKAGQTELGGKVDGVVAELGRARTAVRQLADSVKALTEKPEEEVEPPAPPFCWLTATDAEEAAEQLAALEQWLTEVVAHYPDGVLADCWRRHSWVVEELLVLRDGWIVAYAPGAPISARLDWHNRWRPEVMKRITSEKGLKGCSLAHQRHDQVQMADCRPPRQVGLDDAAAVVAWWTSTHGGSNEPPVTEGMKKESAARMTGSSRFAVPPAR